LKVIVILLERFLQIKFFFLGRKAVSCKRFGVVVKYPAGSKLFTYLLGQRCLYCGLYDGSGEWMNIIKADIKNPVNSFQLLELLAFSSHKEELMTPSISISRF
jgi:hypothetical protein